MTTWETVSPKVRIPEPEIAPHALKHLRRLLLQLPPYQVGALPDALLRHQLPGHRHQDVITIVNHLPPVVSRLPTPVKPATPSPLARSEACASGGFKPAASFRQDLTSPGCSQDDLRTSHLGPPGGYLLVIGSLSLRTHSPNCFWLLPAHFLSPRHDPPTPKRVACGR